MIYTNSDGGARGNPGPGAIGVLVRDENRILLMDSMKIGNYITNNVAEYEALIRALQLASRYTQNEITCYLDSELVVKQLLGEYRVKHPDLKKLFLRVQKLQENFKSIKYIHVPRENKYQKIVDELLNKELDKGY
jgi:ribonuclease HI